ncbi:MAG: hypothetical protein RIA71_09175 [Oceanicaulis sp.]
MNHHLIRAALGAVLIAGCEAAPVAAPEPATPAEAAAYAPELGHSAEVFFNTTSFSLAGGAGYAFSSADGDLLISSDETGVFNAYALDPETGARAAHHIER